MEINGMPNVLACDVGNTRIRFAHVCGEQVYEPRSFAIGDLSELGTGIGVIWNQMPAPRKVVASSVSPSGLRALEAAVSDAINEDVLVIGRDINLPMPTHLPDESAIGTDRLCAAVAAYDRLGVACIVADFGTAATVDAIDADGVFMGGAIFPGISMSAKSLKSHTAELPEVTPRSPEQLIGKNTENAIISGVVHSARGALRELVEAYAIEMNSWPTVILTGGDASLVCPHVGESDLVQAVVPDLTLRGVAITYYRQVADRMRLEDEE
ncbi:MAG: type III pantothenate kinase [Phycisphaerae bacterium]